MIEKGFNGVGLNEILKAVGVPKGSFYHWFPSKEQFGVELIRHYAENALNCKRNWMAKKDLMPNAAQRIIAGMESAHSHLLENDCKQSCLILKLSNEVSSWSDAMRAELQAFHQKLTSIYEQFIQEGQVAGQITKARPAAQLASVVHDIWMGACMRCISQCSLEPMKHAIDFLKYYLPA